MVEPGTVAWYQFEGLVQKVFFLDQDDWGDCLVRFDTGECVVPSRRLCASEEEAVQLATQWLEREIAVTVERWAMLKGRLLALGAARK